MSGFRISETSSNFIHFLRVVASQTVLIGHAIGMYYSIDNSVFGFLPSFSVMVFFVVSGFIISYACSLKSTTYGFKNYLIDRFSRIYITFLPALLITYLLGIAYFYYFHSYPYLLSFRHFFACIFLQHENPLLLQIQYMLPNDDKYKFIGIFGQNLPLWSLSIEWWHYIFFGLFYYNYFGPRKMRFKHKILLLLSLPFIVGYMFFPGRAGYALSFIWFSGVVLNHVISKNSLIIRTAFFPALFLFFTIISFSIVSQLSIVFFIAFFYATIIYLNNFNRENIYSKFFNIFSLQGSYSYSIYIIHYPILVLINKLDFDSDFKFFLSYIISNFAAFLLYILFEKNHKAIASKIKTLSIFKMQ